jgi:hypothetical protein
MLSQGFYDKLRKHNFSKVAERNLKENAACMSQPYLRSRKNSVSQNMRVCDLEIELAMMQTALLFR